MKFAGLSFVHALRVIVVPIEKCPVVKSVPPSPTSIYEKDRKNITLSQTVEVSLWD